MARRATLETAQRATCANATCHSETTTTVLLDLVGFSILGKEGGGILILWACICFYISYKWNSYQSPGKTVQL